MNSKLFIFAILAAILAISYNQSLCTANTINVTGNGQIFLPADIVRFTMYVSRNETTATLALANLNKFFISLQDIFTNIGIPAANYSISNLTLFQSNLYINNTPIVNGSSAIQTLSIIIVPSILPSLLQSLSNITAAQYFVFDLFDHQSAIRQARSAAFNDAKSKLAQYLTLTSYQNDGLMKMLDLNTQVYPPIQSSALLYDQSNKFKTGPQNIQVTASLSILWKVKS